MKSPSLLCSYNYLFDFKDLLNQVVDDKEEEDDLEAHHHVIGPVDVAEQLHRVEAEAWEKNIRVQRLRAKHTFAIE